MEKSRAIELLKLAVPIKALTQQEYSDFVEAVNMAIDALEAQLSCEGTISEPTIQPVATDTNVGDTISRQAAIDAINSWRGRFSEEYNEAIDDCENSIKELPPAQPEPQWIPVSERLPEENGWHICTCHDGVSERVTFLKWQKRLKQWEKTGTRSYWKVIAWMPLPEAYKPNK